ncbi:carbon-nitrogen hydrolase family protein [Lacibacter sp. MH-610]|uniref:carbon-nitrogen hydrolase family protein n=1 Tax=Lacibacter sp. MH-610 TaxID=3020883 RepID=UPI0038919EB9
MKPLRIAIIQHRPVHLNLKLSTEKALALLHEAAKQGAQLLVFGESWLSGYPAWIDHCPEIANWNNEAVKDVFSLMHANSAAIEGEEIKLICNAAKELKVHVVIGMNEKIIHGPGNGTIYNSFIIINDEGRIANHHRKLMPTFNEKLLYGLGDAAGLKIVETNWGRMGGLICWEHWMPLTRQILHNENEMIHFALWPAVGDIHQVASRHYAFEGRCFVIAAGQMMQVKDIPVQLILPEHLTNEPDKYLLNGGSCVIDPKGNYLLSPQFDKEEILYCAIENFDTAIKEKLTMDVSGHYNRTDLFEFSVKRKRNIS